MKKIHDHQVRQRDFKSSNVLCKNGEYFMIDLDSVKIGRLTDKQRIINLAQLNASLSNMIACKDRLRFFYYYAAMDERSRNRRRSIYKKVWEISKTKNTKIFNLDLKKIWEQKQEPSLSDNVSQVHPALIDCLYRTEVFAAGFILARTLFCLIQDAENKLLTSISHMY